MYISDITDVVGKDVGLMIRAFAAALEDENLLVRRAALDILVQSMRVNSFMMKRAQRVDRVILMRAATGVVLRRDLSLNRRLYTWLLGTDERSDTQIRYLHDNALELLSSTLKVWKWAILGVCLHSNCNAIRMKCFLPLASMRSRDHSKYSSHYWTNGKLADLCPTSWYMILLRQ
jgi:hypothetical protein